jgi:serine/threonine-protein kinase
MDALFPEAGSDDDPPAPATAIDGLPRIPGHEVEALIGEGGMGVVYRARHARLNRPVAVKMLRAGAYAGPPERARFQRDAEAWPAHENIADLRRATSATPYFTMELVEGEPGQYLAGTPRPRWGVAPAGPLLARALTRTSGDRNRDQAGQHPPGDNRPGPSARAGHRPAPC